VPSSNDLLLSTSSSTSSLALNERKRSFKIPSHDQFIDLEENFILKTREPTPADDSGALRRNTNINNSLTANSKFNYIS